MVEEQVVLTDRARQMVDEVSKEFAFIAAVSASGLDALVNWRVAARFLGVTTRQAIQARVTNGELERRNGLYRFGDVQSYVSGTGEDLEGGIALVASLAGRRIRTDDKRRFMQDLRASGVTLTDLYTMGRVDRCLKRIET